MYTCMAKMFASDSNPISLKDLEKQNLVFQGSCNKVNNIIANHKQTHDKEIQRFYHCYFKGALV